MSVSATEDFLAQTPLFAGLAPEQLQRLAAIATRRKYRRGETIFTEGEPATGLYIVAGGRVKIYKLSPEGKEQILHVFGPGECFAEVAVFSGEHYPAHALALEHSEILIIPRAELAAMLESDPSLAMNMLASLSRRLKRFAAMIEALSLQEVPARLANHLAYLARRHRQTTFRLDLPKGQLAALLGTSPETLSRIFSRLVDTGILSMDRDRIHIQDQDALAAIAAGDRRL